MPSRKAMAAKLIMNYEFLGARRSLAVNQREEKAVKRRGRQRQVWNEPGI